MAAAGEQRSDERDARGESNPMLNSSALLGAGKGGRAAKDCARRQLKEGKHGGSSKAKQGGSRGDGGKWALLMVDARGGRAGTSHASTGHRLPLPMLTSESSPGRLAARAATTLPIMAACCQWLHLGAVPMRLRGWIACTFDCRVSYYAEYVHRLPTYTRVDT